MKNFSALRLLLLAPLFCLSSAALPSGGLPAKGLSLQIPFVAFSDDIGRRANLEFAHVFTSQREYRLFFGHDAPGVDFDREWIVYQNLGPLSNTPHVSIHSVQLTDAGRVLKITSKHLVPGPNCAAVRLIWAPYTMVKIPAMSALPIVRFSRAYETTDC